MILLTADGYGNSSHRKTPQTVISSASLRNKGNSIQYFWKVMLLFLIFILELASIFSLRVSFLAHHSELECLIMVLLPCSNIA